MNKRQFLRKLVGVPAVVAVWAGKDVAAQEPVQPSVQWPCMQCGTEHLTPFPLWETTRLNLHCRLCGRRQSYVLWLKKLDPAPMQHPPVFASNSLMANLTPTSLLPRSPVMRPYPDTYEPPLTKAELDEARL